MMRHCSLTKKKKKPKMIKIKKKYIYIYTFFFLPLKYFLRMLQRNMHTKVTERLHELFRVNAAFKRKQRHAVRKCILHT